MRYLPSALKRVTKQQIEEALADPLQIEQALEDFAGHSQQMVIGKTLAEITLEIGIRFEEDDDVVFHASIATARN
jgi:hypothetical protein